MMALRNSDLGTTLQIIFNIHTGLRRPHESYNENNVKNPSSKLPIDLIEIQDKQRLFSVHFIGDQKHMYLFVLGFFTVMSF